ncbi:MAG: taurine catabolism dioxygenase TauD [Gammaproteobacteria bacterium]|nr:MAG: taurine catabolism dioxygenase TauD [Gammaproteobacteria bacterium]
MFHENKASYREWRAAKLASYPRRVAELLVEIDGLATLEPGDKDRILGCFRRANMAIYTCRDPSVDRAAIRAFAAHFGLQRLDHHLCANDDGVSELTVTTEDQRAGYVPYSDRSLSWHTDGYYNDDSRSVRAVVLHCAQDAKSGGENAILDPEIAYIRLRDADPAFITAFEHPQCMTIPANVGDQGEIRPAVEGPVFSYGPADGALHMRFSARKRNIRWRDDSATTAAREHLAGLLAEDNGPVLNYCLQPGQGLISNNVLHNRTAFKDGAGNKRLLYRARFFDRVDSS